MSTANEYQLRLANGAKLQEVLDDFAHELAELAREEAAKVYGLHPEDWPLTWDTVLPHGSPDDYRGWLGAADLIDPEVSSA